MIISLLLMISIYAASSDFRKRHIDNNLVFIIGLLSILCSGFEVTALLPYLGAIVLCLFLFGIGAFAGGDIKLLLAYLLGIHTNWWPAVLILITGIGGILAIFYFAFGYFTNNLQAVRERGLPYGVPIAIGGCFGVWLSSF